jgi:Uncharacterized protein conserved in bacteria (DUF2263)
MPPAKPRPAEVAAQAKKTYIPFIEQNYPQWPPGSYLYEDANPYRVPPGTGKEGRLRVAVIDGEPVDVTLDWFNYNYRTSGNATRIPVVNMANDKRPGGDWESGLMAPEENFCRRSNLYHSLTTSTSGRSHYQHGNPPYTQLGIPPLGGIYSPCVGN